MDFLHVRIRVRDLERAIEWYCRSLGFELERRSTSPRGNRLAFLQLPGNQTRLELCYIPDGGDFSFPEDIFHLAFSVDDMQQAFREMAARGVKFTEGPSGGMAFIEDADGYEIELLER